MDINKMTSTDYMNLYYFTKSNNRRITNYKTWKPQLQDIERYNATEKKFKEVWKTNKSKIHKYIALREETKNKNKENDFEGCMEIGHKWELQIEEEFKKYGVDIGMYYDERQFKGENEFGIEIKHDSKIYEYDKKYGTIFIEYLAINKNETDFIDGALLKKDNSIYWLIGNEKDGYFIFYKKTLLDLYKKIVSNKQFVDRCYLKEKRTSKGLVTAKGIVIRCDKARELMIADDIQEFLLKIGEIE